MSRTYTEAELASFLEHARKVVRSRLGAPDRLVRWTITRPALDDVLEHLRLAHVEAHVAPGRRLTKARARKIRPGWRELPADTRRTTLTLERDVIREANEEAAQLERTISWVFAQAWLIARDEVAIAYDDEQEAAKLRELEREAR